MSGNVIAFDGRRRPSAERAREFAETARRLQRERESAAVIVRILADIPRSEWPHLAEDESLRNSGVLDRLSKEVHARMESEPQDALALSNLATTIAETLPPDAYPAVVLAQMKAHAWKDRAQTLSYLSRYDDALASLDRALETLKPFATVAHDRAVVNYVRAMALQYVGRMDEAVIVLGECRRVFTDHADQRLLLYCGIAEGILLYGMTRFTEAAETFAPLLAVARATQDVESEARLHNNLAFALVELGYLSRANEHASEAVVRFYQLGRPLEALRLEQTIGRTLVVKGQAVWAIKRLEDARARFLRHEMKDEATMCGLELVGGLLALERIEQARALGQTIVHEMEREGSSLYHAEALAAFRRALAAHDPAPAIVRHVSDFLAAWRSNPALAFDVSA